MALASLRWIPSPKDATKARDLADMVRQGLSLKQVVEFFRTNPRADWYTGLRELRKGVGYMTPVGGRAVEADPLAGQKRDLAAAKAREAGLSEEAKQANRDKVEAFLKRTGG